MIALSSGEAEFYALVRGAAAGLLTVQIWERVGFKGTKLTMRTDSSAAKGIARNQLRVQKEPTKTNWADLGAKALSGSRVSELVKGMPLTRGLVMACLFASFGVATGQPKEDKLENVDLAFFAYMLILHILAIQSILFWIRSACAWCTRPRTTTKVAHFPGRTNRQDPGQNVQLYTTRKGKKFHKRHGRHLGQGHVNTWQRIDAINRGITPCADCNP